MGRTRRLGGFALAGGVGFAVDAVVLLTVIAAGAPAWVARIPSFLAAVTATWAINRRLAFRTAAAPTLREFRAYLGAMSVGLAVNLASYMVALLLGAAPLLALVVASGAGMVVNYLGARRVLGG